MAQQQTFRLTFIIISLAAILGIAGCTGDSDNTAIGEEAVQDQTSLTSPREEEADEETASAEEFIRSGDPATDDVEYIHQLGLIRGHLIAFMDLYRAGAKDMAMRHAKHPSNEIYNDLVPAFEARGLDGFSDELSVILDIAMANGAVDDAYTEFVMRVDAHMPGAPVSINLLAIAAMIETAGEEYALGVDVDGKIVQPHEYQDAYGFLNAARELLASEETTDINESEAITLAHEQLDQALGQFSALLVEETEGQVSVIYQAASTIEAVGLALR